MCVCVCGVTLRDINQNSVTYYIMTPTHQALLPGRRSRITGQVVQQAVEVVRLSPLNRTVGCSCKQGFLTLSKMHVKTPLKFWFHFPFFPEITFM